MDINKAHETFNKVADNIKTVIKGKDGVITKLLAAFFSGGHVLLEDVPGTGKTTLAKSLAKSIYTDFKRVQFTPDILPSDIIGVSMYNQKEASFEFRKGPIFTNILLVDEINRASPRTQSALLESMAELQVSTEGEKMDLGELFFVIATQNNIESHGTYPLPEAQMDRFMVELSLGYVSIDEEVSILTSQANVHPLEKLKSVTNEDEIKELREYLKTIRISEELLYYIVDIVSSTRNAKDVLLGAGSRASIALMRMSQAMAVAQNMDFVTPEHIQSIAKDVIAHRLVIEPQAKFSGISARGLVKNIIESVKVPV